MASLFDSKPAVKHAYQRPGSDDLILQIMSLPQFQIAVEELLKEQKDYYEARIVKVHAKYFKLMGKLTLNASIEPTNLIIKEKE